MMRPLVELGKRVSAMANYASELMVQIPDNTAAGKEIVRILGKALMSFCRRQFSKTTAGALPWP